jgi:pimeloyl-ACP methyl ester carboxylesterase
MPSRIANPFPASSLICKLLTLNLNIVELWAELGDITTSRLVFVQHGWADTNRVMLRLAEILKNDLPPDVKVSAPNLGWWRTWREFAPLKQKVEEDAQALIAQYPLASVDIIGHSMGGLIWLEILADHPEWWSKVRSLVLLAVPVGGSDLARIFDPRFLHAHWQVVKGAYHAQMRLHPEVIASIRSFWQNPQVATLADNTANQILQYIYSLSLTDAHPRDLKFATAIANLRAGFSLWQWYSPLQIRHLFVTDHRGELIYAGFAGWADAQKIDQAIAHLVGNFGTKN